MSDGGRYRLTAAANADLAAILRFTGRQFGRAHRRDYAALIVEAMTRVALHPERPGSQRQGAIGDTIRSYPIRLAGRRANASPHILFYVREGDGIAILRILHAAMDPTQHLAP